MAAKVTFANVNGHKEPVPHVSLRTEQREESAPAYTPTGPGSLATTGGGVVKQRHGRASDSGSSVDADEQVPADTTADEAGVR